MSDVLDFLWTVLPSDGYYCLAKPLIFAGKDGKVVKTYQHKVVNSVEEMLHIAQMMSNSKTDVFYTVGTLKEERVWNQKKKDEGGSGWEYRTHSNIKFIKTLHLDLDCGSTKDYPTQNDAVKALQAFCKASGWFKPTYINSSGKGIHAYWVFNKQVPTESWHQLAERFKAITKHFGLKADPVCTSDKARVLRVPGTFNWKNPDDPKPVKVLFKGVTYPVAEIQDKIKSILAEHTIAFKKRAEPLPDHLKQLFADKVSNLQQVSEVDAEPIYEGCAQMARVRALGGTVGYSMRTCAVSIIKLTKNPDYGLLLNDPNPEQVGTQTESMLTASVTDNPSTCERFEGIHPEGCKGCQYQGKIKSPITLGKRIKSIYDEPKPAEPVTESPTEQLAAEFDTKDAIEFKEYEVKGKKYKVLPPPSPYTHAKNGVWGKIATADDVEQDVMIADFMILPIECGVDHTKKGIASVKIYLQNGVDPSFTIDCPMAEISSSDGFKKYLANYGVLDRNTEKSTALIKYMTAYIKHLQSKLKSVENHGALGWQDDDHTKFVMPSGVYDRQGNLHPASTSSSATTAMSSFAKKGTLEEWKSVVNTYARKGYEDYAFAHLVGYGSIVFSISGYSGAVVSMVGNSGSGKSTVLETINSVYGKPKNYLNQADTMNAKMNRLAIYKNIPVTYDEITNMQHDELSQFVYSVSQGRSKLRLDQNGNEKDSTNNSWQMILACTSNSNLVDKLSAYKQDASAESMRIFEFYINRREDMRYDEARKIFDKLQDNYGHAGDLFMAEFMQKVDKVKALYDSIVTKLSNELDASSKERYWIAVAASVIAGGIISQKLGLHDFNMDNIYKWAVNQINSMRGLVQENVKSPQATLVDFLNSILNRTLVLGGGVVEKNKISNMYPLVEPQDAVWARTEKDRNVMYVDQQKLRDYVTKGGSDFNNLKTALVREGIVLETGVNKVLTRDSNKARTGNTRCWKIDLGHSEMADVRILPTGVSATLEGDKRA